MLIENCSNGSHYHICDKWEMQYCKISTSTWNNKGKKMHEIKRRHFLVYTSSKNYVDHHLLRNMLQLLTKKKVVDWRKFRNAICARLFCLISGKNWRTDVDINLFCKIPCILGSCGSYGGTQVQVLLPDNVTIFLTPIRQMTRTFLRKTSHWETHSLLRPFIIVGP